MDNVQEFAALKRVKIMTAGKHNNKVVKDSDLDLMAEHTDACLDYINKSREVGEYTGNKVNLHGKPIPSFLNLNHQEDLAETMRQAAKNITVKLYTTLENGKKWLMADLLNVPNDIAAFVRNRYPLRSIEWLPPIYHPDKQRVFTHALQSISFLSPDKPPAVAGQTNDFVVEYSTAPTEAEIETYTINTEVQSMDDVKKTETPPVADAAVKEFQKALETKDAELTAIRQELAAQKARFEEAEVKTFCDALVLNASKQPKCVTPALKEQLLRLDNSQVLEFAEGQKQTAREWWMRYLTEHLPTVPVGEFAAQQTQENNKPKSAAEEIETFAAKAKEMYPTADTQDLYLAQVRLWTDSKRGGK